MKTTTAVLILYALGGAPVCASEIAVSTATTNNTDQLMVESKKALESLEKFQKRYMGSMRSPQTPEEWKQLDRAAKKGPEDCYRWLDLFSAEMMGRFKGTTWKELGEADGIAACRKTAARIEDLKMKERRSKVLSSLAKLQTAVMVYYGEHEGVYPEFLEQLVPKYIASIPPVPLDEHPGAEMKIHTLAAKMPTDTGGWGYVPDPKSSDYGAVIINCNHLHRGKPLSDY